MNSQGTALTLYVTPERLREIADLLEQNPAGHSEVARDVQIGEDIEVTIYGEDLDLEDEDLEEDEGDGEPEAAAPTP